MVAAHHVADDLGALAVLGVGSQVLLPHRVEDAALHRLQAVADVGQRARRDDRQRVVEVARLRRFVQRYSVCAVAPPPEAPPASPAVSSPPSRLSKRVVRRLIAFGHELRGKGVTGASEYACVKGVRKRGAAMVRRADPNTSNPCAV